MPTPASRYVVLSDMHFGTPESSVNHAGHRAALVKHLVSRAPYDELVMTGDLLDTNLSTLTLAIEGLHSPSGGDPPLFGFREFLRELDVAAKSAGKDGLTGIAKRWVYVPGNHDYKIFDVLSTQIAFANVVAAGQPMGTVKSPLASGVWHGNASYLGGLFKPFQADQAFTLEYPNHEITLGKFGTMLLTHGHYFDASQTLGNDLREKAAGLTTPAERQALVRKVVIATAQYQTVANAVAFTLGTRNLVGAVVGPAGLMNKLSAAYQRVRGWFARLLFPTEGALRGQDISRDMLESIEAYLQLFNGGNRPRWFVFGHTHKQGHAPAVVPGMDVYNVGSCYPDGRKQITFIEVEVPPDLPAPVALAVEPAVALMHVDASSTVCSS